MREMRNAYNVLVRNVKGRDNSEDLGVDGRIIVDCPNRLRGRPNFQDLSLGFKRPGCKADHSPPSSGGQECVELTSTPQYVFMAWC
jgi:hypothetical protein